MIDSQGLTLEEALARLSVVSLIQLVGFGAIILLVRWVPGWRCFRIPSKTEWQCDCLKIARFFGYTSLGALFVTFILCTLFSWSAGIPETVIRGVFGVNTIFFAWGMARTGGPSRSFFGQLVPIQLSGILVLEQQKAMITNTQLTTWTFAAFSTVMWLAAVLCRKRVAQWRRWSEFTIEPGLERFTVFAATVLFVLSVGVTVLAYWLPLQPWFIAFIRSHRRI